MYTVYMIVCKTPRHVYFGSTKHFISRILQHKRGHGSRFTKAHGVKNYYVLSLHWTREEAVAAEYQWGRRLCGMRKMRIGGGGCLIV